MGGPAAEMTLKPRFFDKVFVFLRIVYMIAIGYEIAQVFGVLVAFACLVMVWMFCTHVFSLIQNKCLGELSYQ